MNPLKKVQRVALFIGLWTLVSACAYGGLLYAVSAKQTSLDALYTAVGEADNKKTTSEALERFVQETGGDRAKIDTYFLDPSNATVVTLLEDIESLGKLAHVSVKVSDVADATRPLQGILRDAKGTFDVVSLTVAYEGSWADTYRFLTLLEHMGYASTIEKTSIEYNTSDTTKLPVWHGTTVMTVAKK